MSEAEYVPTLAQIEKMKVTILKDRLRTGKKQGRDHSKNLYESGNDRADKKVHKLHMKKNKNLPE